MKIYTLHVLIWVMCTATMAAPILEQSPISDGEHSKGSEESGDPDLVEFASRLRTGTGGSELQPARPSSESSTVEANGPGRALRKGDGACFCSGGSVCCRQDAGAIDCGFGLCGI